MKLPAAHAEFQSLSKQDLHELADRLLIFDSIAIDYCVEFIIAETKGNWHGRARAKMCRRLKYCELAKTHRTKLLACILERLRTGRFSEQFKDQLRLALYLDLQQTHEVCEQALLSPKHYVQRYASWAVALPYKRET